MCTPTKMGAARFFEAPYHKVISRENESLSFWLPLRPTFTKVPLRVKTTAQTPEFSEFSEFSSPGLQPAPPSSPAWQNVEEPPGPPPGPRLEPPVLANRTSAGGRPGPFPRAFLGARICFLGVRSSNMGAMTCEMAMTFNWTTLGI